MIINKSSFERGFGYGVIYKSEHVDLKIILKNPTTKVCLHNIFSVNFQVRLNIIPIIFV